MRKIPGFKMLCMIALIMLAILFTGKLWAEECATPEPAEYTESNDKPAVSKLNAKVGGGYADLNADSTHFGAASVTVPLTHRFGLSIDALGGDYSADSLWGAGGSLFWRNPDKGLLGVMGSNVQVGANNAYRSGLTGELYFDKFSILADAGYLEGDTIRAGAFGDMQLRWYPYDNLALGAGPAYANNVVAGIVSMEFMPAPKVMPGLALFVDGSWGNKDYHSVMAGARYYFGGTGKTLKQKHREDDPPNHALQGLMLCSQGDCFKPQNLPTDDGGADDIVDDIITDDTEADDIGGDDLSDTDPV